MDLQNNTIKNNGGNIMENMERKSKGLVWGMDKDGDILTNIYDDGKLSQEDVEAISNELEGAASETTKHLREIMAEGENDNGEYPRNVLNKKVNKVLANVEINPETGEKILSPDQSMVFKDNGIKIEDVVEGEDIGMLKDITEDNMKNSLKNMDMTDEEVMMMINAMNKNESGQAVKYEELPFSVQQMVDGLRRTCGETGLKISVKNIISDILGFFKSQLAMDQEIVNLEDSLKKELNFDLIGEFTRETDKMMEDKLIEIAKLAEENGETEKAKELRTISETYIDAKNFLSLKKAVIKNQKCARKLERELSRWNKYVRDFNFKYEHDTRFGIDSIENVLKVLRRHMKPLNYDEAICKEFLILFCRYTQNMSPKSVSEHTFMYYTLKTIMNLDVILPDDDLYKNIVNKLDSIMAIL